MTALLHLTLAEPLPSSRLRVTFSTGEKRTVDLTGYLTGPVFEPLRDPSAFEQAFLDPETRMVAWPNGADLAPEFLYDLTSPSGDGAPTADADDTVTDADFEVVDEGDQK